MLFDLCLFSDKHSSRRTKHKRHSPSNWFLTGSNRGKTSYWQIWDVNRLRRCSGHGSSSFSSLGWKAVHYLLSISKLLFRKNQQVTQALSWSTIYKCAARHWIEFKVTVHVGTYQNIEIEIFAECKKCFSIRLIVSEI